MRTFVRLSCCILLVTFLVPALASGADRPRPFDPGIILPPPATCHGAFPGDADGSGEINIADVTTIIGMLCHGYGDLDNPANGDVNADCEIDLDDVYYLIDYMFRGGPAPMDCVCGDPLVLGCEASCEYVVSGDANADGELNISDVVFLIDMLCHDGPPPFPLGNGDVNADCEIDLDDVYYLIDYMFAGGPEPMDCQCGAPLISGCTVTCDIVFSGDANGDDTINISDVVYLINFLCHDGPPPSPLGNGDTNADCVIDLDDVYYLIDYMFAGGPAPDCVCGLPTFVGCEASCEYVTPGDADNNGRIDIADVVHLVSLLCHDGPPPVPLGNGDVNADCVIDEGDVDYLIAYMFEGGPAPMDCVCGAPTIGACSFDCEGVVPGDVNSDGGLDISDVVALIDFLCHGGEAPDPLGNADVNGDCVVNMDDIDWLIAYMFEGGPEPADCMCGNPAVGECDQGKSGALETRPEIRALREGGVPASVGLWQNNPNPFNPKTTISFSLPAAAQVRLEVVNVMGERVKVLVDEVRGPGPHAVTWDGTDATGANTSAGVYFYRIVAGEYTQTRKMMLIK